MDPIQSAPSLDALLIALQSHVDSLWQARRNGQDVVDPVDWTSLPTFGGEPPADTCGVWSWDADRLLVGDGQGDLQIVARSDRAPIPPVLDQRAAVAVLAKLRAIAAQLGEQHGVRVLFLSQGLVTETASGPANLTVPVQVCAVGADNVVWSDAAVRFAANAESRGFNPAALGAGFVSAGESYRFVGLRLPDDDPREALAVSGDGAPKRFALRDPGIAALLAG